MHVIHDPELEDLYVVQRGSKPLPARFWTLLRSKCASQEEYNRTKSAWMHSRKATPQFIMSLLQLKKEVYESDKTDIVDFSIFLVNSKLPNVVSMFRDTSGEETLHLNHEAHTLDVIIHYAKECDDTSIPVISHDKICSVMHHVRTIVKARTPILVRNIDTERLHVIFSDASITLANPAEIQEIVVDALRQNVLVISPLQWLHEYGEWSITVQKE